ncbi:TPR repeat-containing protein [Calothrix brevissima NIES-22]|nr:TPR repeat-containing protein [Calothrix brevissima NIES-22]
MHNRLKSLSLASLVLYLSLSVGVAESQTKENVQTSLTAQTQTTQELRNEALRLKQLGDHQFNRGQFQEALKSFEQCLIILKKIGEHQGEGIVLTNIGAVYRSQGQYSEALDYYQQALSIFKQLNDRNSQGDTLALIGSIHYQLTDYVKALEFYQQALAIYKQNNDELLEGVVLGSMATIYADQGDYSQALNLYEQALTISRRINDKVGETKRLNNLGTVYSELGNYSKALELFQQSLAISIKLDDKAGEANNLNNIASVYIDMGDYSKALYLAQQALAIQTKIGNQAALPDTFIIFGNIYLELGQYATALEKYNQALGIIETSGNPASKANILQKIAGLYTKLGQYEKALDLNSQALNIYSKIDSKSGMVNIFNNIGRIYEQIGKYEEALKLYQNALNILNVTGANPAKARTFNNIGSAYWNLRQYDQALNYYQQALVIRQESGIKEGQAKTLNNIALVYYNQGKYTQALNYYQQALVIARQLKDQESEAITLTNIGEVYNALGNYSDAETNLFSAIEVWNKLRLILKDDEKISLFERQTFTYLLLQQVLIAQNKINIALEVSEQARARAFVELLASRISGNIANQQLIKPPNFEKIKQIAKSQNATLVEYSILGESNLYIWVVKPTGEVGFKQEDLKSLNTPLAQLVNKTRIAIGAGGRGIFSEVKDTDAQKQNLQKLHEVLIEPIASLLPTNPDEKVIFIPHDALFLVPFVALQDKDGKYLIEKHTILTAPSIQVLDLTRQQRQKVTGKDVLVMGNPIMPKVGIPPVQLPSLAGAEKEAVTVASLFKTKAITGKDATETAFKEKLSSARMIHLATHGLLDDADKSIPSAIALTPTSNDDGLLTPAEIVNLRINAELVVLSACDTGRGKITGDGVIGLSRSLITAGAPSVIVSLWAVPDSPTSELMTEFYQQWQKNPDKAVALRNAMLITMKKHPRPIDWAAFTLIGES